MKPRVHDLDDVFAERNMFLQVSLGLISLCLGFEELLAAQGALLRQGPEGVHDPSGPSGSARQPHAENAHRLGAQEMPPVLRLQMPGQPAAAGAPATQERPILDFILGLAAFSQRLLLHAEEASVAPQRADRREGDRRYSLRGLLT